MRARLTRRHAREAKEAKEAKEAPSLGASLQLNPHFPHPSGLRTKREGSAREVRRGSSHQAATATMFRLAPFGANLYP